MKEYVKKEVLRETEEERKIKGGRALGHRTRHPSVRRRVGIDQGVLVGGKSLDAYPAHDGPGLVVCHQGVGIVGEEMADLGA